MIKVFMFTLCTLLASESASARPISALYVFGDSLSDTGNTYVAGQAVQTVPIPSVGFIPDDAYENRGASFLPALSNGATWNEQVAEALGVLQDPSRRGGTNYAQLGARMTPGVNPDNDEPSVVDQFRDFASQSSGSDGDANALYAVWGGGNDARDATFAVVGGRADIADQLIAGYGQSLDFVIRGLIAEGAEKIIVPNVPSIGFSPAIGEAAALFGQPELIFLANSISSEFNVIWAQTLLDIETELGIDLIEVDVFNALGDVVTNPIDYGLTNVTQGCAFFANCIVDSTGFLFWDGLHPTTQGHSIIAAAVLAAIPEPKPVELILAGVMSFLVVRWRDKKSVQEIK
ncbi:MAG: SGNH/GDSL hydrolase family protein [Methylococcales bacterium]